MENTVSAQLANIKQLNKQESATLDPLERTMAMQDVSRKRFLQSYCRAGYRVYPPEPLMPNADNSLLLTNSTIVPLKPFLIGEQQVPPVGVVLSQPCIRAHNLEKVFEHDFIPNYLCHFEMLGTLTTPNRFVEANNEVFSYLITEEEIPRDQIIIEASNSHTEFIDEWCKYLPSSQIRLDTHTTDYYEWQYGVSGLAGHGITFALLRPEDDTVIPIGNIIALAFHGKEVGIEVALGLECLLAAKKDSRSCVDVSIAGAIVKPTTPTEYRIADLIQGIVPLYHAGLTIGHNRAGYLQKKMLKALLVNSESEGISIERVIGWAGEYERAVFAKNSEGLITIEQDILAVSRQREKNRSRMLVAVEKAISRADTTEDICNVTTYFLREGSATYGMLPEEIGKLIESVLREKHKVLDSDFQNEANV